MTLKISMETGALGFVKGAYGIFLCLVLLGGWSASVHAGQAFKHGAVIARAMALDENGQPILVEYNEDGSEAGEVALGEYADRVNELQIISAYEYRTQLARWNEFRERPNNPLAEDAELLSRAGFLQRGSYSTADNKQITNPGLAPHVKSVAVRGRSSRFGTDPQQLILLSFSVDLTQNFSPAETGSIVINEDGHVVASSTRNIAPRTGFFGDPSKPQDLYGGFIRKHEDQIFGPVPFIKVYVDEFAYPGGVGVTDSEGKYSFRFHMPFCPGGMDMTTDVWADMYYTNFSPNGSPTLPYYLRRQDWTYCYDPIFLGGSLGGMMAYSDALAIQAASSIPMYAIDLYVDVMFLTGRVRIGNPGGSPGSFVPIPIGDVTEYAAKPLDDNTIPQQQYDFDGDGEPDRAVLGNLFEETLPDGSTAKLFKPAPDDEGKYALQGVYFSSRTDQTGDPDVIRQADNKKELGHNGLLSSISEEDFKNTDILVFRESTGQLVMERRGLRDAEIDGRAQVGLGQGDDNVFYSLMLRGPKDSKINIGGTNRAGNWNDWATRNQLTEPFAKQDGDHLRPGEWIRLVVINRATGYMGTQRIQLSDASQNPGGYLNIPVEDIVMRPPNLKIWAERTYQVEHGLSADDKDRRFLIGAEGAGLVDDAMIEVYSEWYDHDGRPLPEGLGVDNGENYGLSGRLAKVVSDNYIEAESDLAIFPIGPGRQTQLLKIKDNLTVPEHFYIHVSGTQKDESPQFDAAGDVALEPFNSRPRTLTPFLAPLYDENKDWETYNAYRDLLREQADAETPDPDAVTPQKPLPSYVWSYRPEYQFSQYDLEIAEINRVNLNEQGEEEKENILDLSTPVISSGDQLIEFLYSLTGNTSALLDRLSPIDGPQDLVLALGEEEVKLTLGQNQQIRIENIEHLASLNPEDFLTMRLYVNQDAGNILWEYAFEYLVLYTTNDLKNEFEEFHKKTYYLTADDPVLPLEAVLIGYMGRPEERREPKTIRWIIEGQGSLTERVVESDNGIFRTTLTMPTNAGARAKIYAELMGDDQTRVSFPEVIVLPGEAASVSLQNVSGTTYTQGAGSALLNAAAYDRFGNRLMDGTPIDFSINGDGYLLSQDYELTNGRAEAVVKGSWQDNGQMQITAQVGTSVSSSVGLAVQPLDVEIQGLPDTLLANTQYPFVARIINGPEKADKFIDTYFSHGRVIYQDLKTNDNGEVRGILKVGSATGEARLVLRANATQETVVPLTIQETSVTPSTILVSDSNSAANLQYRDFNNNSYSLAVPSNAAIHLSGVPDSTWQLSTNDPFNPNKLPVFQLMLVGGIDDLFDHEISLNNLSNEFDTGASSGRALVFDETDSELNVELNPEINLTQVGVKLEFSADSSSRLVNIGDGLYVLSTNSQNQLVLNAIGTEGVASLTSSEISANWSEVAFGVRDGQLYLAYGDQEWSQPFTASPEFTSRSLKIEGNNFEGRLGGLTLFDFTGPSIIRLAGDEREASGSFDASGSSTVQVSLATANVLPASTAMERVTVGLKKNGQRVAGVTIIQSAYYQLYAAMAHNVMQGSYSEAAFLETIAPVAHETRLDAIPGALFDLGTDTSQFGPLNALIGSLGYLALHPEGSQIQDHLTRLQAFYASSENPALVVALADYLVDTLKRLKQGDTSGYEQLRISLVVWVELLANDPQMARMLGNSIKSKEDAANWLMMMSLPARGWAGDVPPLVAVDQLCLDESALDSPYAGTPLEIIPLCRMDGPRMAGMLRALYDGNEANIENNPQQLSRFAKTWVETMLAATPDIRLLLTAGDYQITAPPTAGVFIPGISRADAAIPVIVWGGLIVGAKWVAKDFAVSIVKAFGKQGLKKAKNYQHFVAGRSNSRIHPFTLLAAVGYLESRMTESCVNDPSCLALGEGLVEPGLRQNLWDKTDSLILHTLSRILLSAEFKGENDLDNPGACRMTFHYHGLSFELMLLAYYHARAEFLGGEPVRALQSTKTITMYTKHGGHLSKYTDFKRYVDIELGASGAEKTIWIEAKSVQAYAANTPVNQRGMVSPSQPGTKLNGQINNRSSSWRQWTASQAQRGSGQKTTPHRQFFLDRVALENVNDESDQLMPSSIIWNLHSWPECYKTVRSNKKDYSINTGVSFLRGKTIKGDRSCKKHSINNLSADHQTADFDYLQSHMAKLPKPPSASPITDYDGPVYASLGYIKRPQHLPNQNDLWERGPHQRAFVAFDPVAQLLAVPQFEDQFGLGSFEQTVLEYFGEVDLDAVDQALEYLDKVRLVKFESVEEKIEELLQEIEEKVMRSNACEASQQANVE